jgi:hypothetical protein
MRHTLALLVLSLGLLASACADSNALGPSQSDDFTISAGKTTTGGKGGVGGSAGGIKGNGR